MTQIRFKLLIIVLEIFFLSPLVVAFSAEKDAGGLSNWDNFYQNCDDFILDGFSKRLAGWKAWQADSDSAFSEIQTHLHTTCPHYYEKKQDSETIGRFSKENLRIGKLAISIEKKGLPILNFLDRNFQEMEKIDILKNLGFLRSRCGQRMKERVLHMETFLKSLKDTMSGFERNCNQAYVSLKSQLKNSPNGFKGRGNSAPVGLQKRNSEISARQE